MPVRVPARPRPHPSRGPGVTVGCRFKTPDRLRLELAASASGLTLSDWVRGLVLDALDAADGRPEARRGPLSHASASAV